MGCHCCSTWGKVDKILLGVLIGCFSVIFLICVSMKLRSIKHHRDFDAFKGVDRHRYPGSKSSREGMETHRGGGMMSASMAGPDKFQDQDFEEVECKLSSYDISRTYMQCSKNRLQIWCTTGLRGPGSKKSEWRRLDISGGGSPEEEGRRRPGSQEGRPGRQEGRPGRQEESPAPGSAEEGMSPEDVGMLGNSRILPEPMMPEPEHMGNVDEGFGSGMLLGSEDDVEISLKEIADKPDMAVCMRMYVTLGDKLTQVKRVLAHTNFNQADTFPMCSFISCESNKHRRKELINKFRHHWHCLLNKPAKCLVNRSDPSQVFIMNHRPSMKDVFVSPRLIFPVSVLLVGIICTVVLVIRRCGNKKLTTKVVVPEKQRIETYVVCAPQAPGEMSDKEKEAMGLSDPGVVLGATNPPLPNFLVVVPPSYNESMNVKSIAALTPPPAYVSTVSLHGDEEHSDVMTPAN